MTFLKRPRISHTIIAMLGLFALLCAGITGLAANSSRGLAGNERQLVDRQAGQLCRLGTGDPGTPDTHASAVVPDQRQRAVGAARLAAEVSQRERGDGDRPRRPAPAGRSRRRRSFPHRVRRRRRLCRPRPNACRRCRPGHATDSALGGGDFRRRRDLRAWRHGLRQSDRPRHQSVGAAGAGRATPSALQCLADDRRGRRRRVVDQRPRASWSSIARSPRPSAWSPRP